jgi:hypothetical protein
VTHCNVLAHIREPLLLGTTHQPIHIDRVKRNKDGDAGKIPHTGPSHLCGRPAGYKNELPRRAAECWHSSSCFQYAFYPLGNELPILGKNFPFFERSGSTQDIGPAGTGSHASVGIGAPLSKLHSSEADAAKIRHTAPSPVGLPAPLNQGFTTIP